MSEKPNTFSGQNPQQIIDRASTHLHSKGQVIQSPHGEIKTLKSSTLVWNHPNPNDNSPHMYPTWNHSSVEWYLDHFVRDTNSPPEQLDHKYIFPFTYAWRMRMHDQGWSHALNVVNLLQKFNYSDLPFERPEDILQLIQETYHYIHPELVLAVLAWLKKENLLLFLVNSQIPQELLNSTRQDLLQNMIDFVAESPYTTQACTPSMLYANIDFLGVTSSAPALQNLHLIVNFTKPNSPPTCEILSFFRELEVTRGAQLELATLLEWGQNIALQTELLLTRITLHTNLLYLRANDKQTNPPISILNHLLQSYGSYSPNQYDINQLIRSPAFLKKVAQTLQIFHQE